MLILVKTVNVYMLDLSRKRPCCRLELYKIGLEDQQTLYSIIVYTCNNLYIKLHERHYYNDIYY